MHTDWCRVQDDGLVDEETSGRYVQQGWSQSIHYGHRT